MNWINVKDKLPQTLNSGYSEKILIQTNTGYWVGYYCYHSNEWIIEQYSCLNISIKTVLFWMPIPFNNEVADER